MHGTNQACGFSIIQKTTRLVSFPKIIFQQIRVWQSCSGFSERSIPHTTPRQLNVARHDFDYRRNSQSTATRQIPKIIPRHSENYAIPRPSFVHKNRHARHCTHFQQIKRRFQDYHNDRKRCRADKQQSLFPTRTEIMHILSTHTCVVYRWQ